MMKLRENVRTKNYSCKAVVKDDSVPDGFRRCGKSFKITYRTMGRKILVLNTHGNIYFPTTKYKKGLALCSECVNRSNYEPKDDDDNY